MKRHLWISLLICSSGMAITPLPAQSQFANLEVGSTITTTNIGGEAQTIRLLDADVVATASDRSLTLYTAVRQDSDQQWQPLCNPNSNGDTRALALLGQWNRSGAYIDNSEITMACTSGVIGKCVLLGYHPEGDEDALSRQRHQACTRMVRADYCGDGVSHTRDGTAIDLYDGTVNPGPTENSGMAFEAAWGVDGAVWVERTRWPESLAYVQENCPERLANEALDRSEIQGRFPEALLFNDSFVQTESLWSD